MIHSTLDALRVPVSSLQQYARNPRRGDVSKIAESLEKNGQYRPIVVNSRDQQVLAGNHTLAAALELGWDEIAVTFVDVDPDQAARIILVDNRSNDLASYDDQALVDLLRELPDLAGTGYDQGDLARFLLELDPQAPPPDEAPALPEEPTSKLGDLYVLGNHRLLCGSSTDANAVNHLLNNEAVDLIVTDPPYGVAYVGKTRDALTIKNDALSPGQTRELFRDALNVSGLRPGGVVYATVPPGNLHIEFVRALEEAELPMRQGLTWVVSSGDPAESAVEGEDFPLVHTLVWAKDRFVLGRSDYHYCHETILYTWREGAPHYFAGGRKQDSVWEIPRPKASREHPTMKPVELFGRMVQNSSRPDEVVYDPFLGSGTTLMACEQFQRRGRGMEADPRYVDVIVDRWERHTGQTAELVREAEHAAV